MPGAKPTTASQGGARVAGNDREVGKVVIKEWKKDRSADTGIFFYLSCRDFSSFRLHRLGPLCLWQCFTVRNVRELWAIAVVGSLGERGDVHRNSGDLQ